MRTVTTFNPTALPAFLQRSTGVTPTVRGSQGVFTPLAGAKPLVSSGAKRVYRGRYTTFNGLSHDAIAVVFEPRANIRLSMETATLVRNSLLDVGPRFYELTCGAIGPNDLSNTPVIIEEDAGISLEDALFNMEAVPGDTPCVLHPLETNERAIENSKIFFDVLAQAYSLHTHDIYHRDLRAANICVRRHGPLPQDIRATLIDFETSSSLEAGEPQARALLYYDKLFEELPMALGSKARLSPTPMEVDLGYLAALHFELWTGKSIKEASAGELVWSEWPFFSYCEDGRIFAHHLDPQEDIVVHAKAAGLESVDDEAFSDPAAQSFIGERFKKFGFMDAHDQMIYEESRSIYGFIALIAHEIFRRYKEHRRSNGQEPEFEKFDDQPLSLRESNYAQARAIVEKMELLGYRILPMELCENDEHVTALKEEEIEYLAYVEHRRWVDERVNNGWTLGERDPNNKKTPYLVPYDQLSEEVKDFDRQPVRDILPILDAIGLVLCK